MAEQITADIDALLAAPELQNRINVIQRDRDAASGVQTEDGQVMTDEFDFSSLTGVIFTSLNGQGDVPEQRVRVEYLVQEQLLLLPKALGIHPALPANSEATHDATIVQNYVKAARMTYVAIYDLINSAGTVTNKIARFAEINVNNVQVARPRWMEPGYYVREGNVPDSAERANLVFCLFSRMLKMNCDIRDTGALVGLKLDMRMTDDAWINPQANPRTRLTSKLMPYTMQMIAALNMPPCSGFAIGAWTRAFGVCGGVLPTVNTLLRKEWKYTSAAPLPANVLAVDAEHTRLGTELGSLCLNIIAMFGLLHLNKNHTFITGDASMTRICTSYINTLRTMVPVAIIEELKGNMEVTCRTAVHPFGLGQTYCVADILHSISGLASPLDLRMSVTPPLTQRLMIVAAAAAEWEQLPVGQSMTKLFNENVEAIRKEIDVIKGDPPHYSELHRYYGYEDMKTVDEKVKKFATAMMPVVGGYAAVLHTTGRDEKDGIALAMSFLNVNRESRAATAAYTTLWNKYIDTLEEANLEEFMTQAFALQKQGMAAGAAAGTG